MKITKLKIVLTTLLTVALLGCAGVDPSSLKKTNTNELINLQSSLKYSESFVAGKQHYTLKAGKYKSLFTDGTGIYYEGEGKCFNIKYENNLPEENLRCGIYLTKIESEDPKIYFYRDPDASAKVFKDANATGTLIHGFDQAELDNLHIFKYQPAPGVLRKAIKLQK